MSTHRKINRIRYYCAMLIAAKTDIERSYYQYKLNLLLEVLHNV